MTAKYVGGSGSVVVNLQGEVVGMLTHAGSLDAATGFVDSFSYTVNLAGQTIPQEKRLGLWGIPPQPQSRARSERGSKVHP